MLLYSHTLYLCLFLYDVPLLPILSLFFCFPLVGDSPLSFHTPLSFPLSQILGIVTLLPHVMILVLNIASLYTRGLDLSWITVNVELF